VPFAVLREPFKIAVHMSSRDVDQIINNCEFRKFAYFVFSLRILMLYRSRLCVLPFSSFCSFLKVVLERYVRSNKTRDFRETRLTFRERLFLPTPKLTRGVVASKRDFKLPSFAPFPLFRFTLSVFKGVLRETETVSK